MNAPQGMSCPIDGALLVMSERQGIGIDYCPTCRGVWLDRGELDKIIERSAADAPQPARHYSEHRSGYEQDKYRHGRKRKSFLHELFD